MMSRRKNYEVLMRVQNTKIKMVMSIPVDKPDKNGVIFTKNAIENAISNLWNLPIIFRDNDGCTDGIVIGTTIESPIAEWNDETQTCELTINGLLFHSGAEIMANKINDGKITDFNFMSIGLTT